MKTKYHVGVDCGNGTIKVVIIDDNNKLMDSVYLENQGVIKTLSKAFKQIKHYPISSCGIVGAGRKLANIIIGSDLIKTEIIAHTIGVINSVPRVKTLIDLGKEDGKKIKVNNKIIEDSEMNQSCSAGCGSYLENVAYRFNIKIEDFGDLALKSKNKAHIDSMCSVFGTSSAQNLFNTGVAIEDIFRGVANSLVRNFKNIFISGKVEEPVVFTGGVSKNKAVVKEFEEQLNCKIIVPNNSHLMGAIGAAILGKKIKGKTNFKGFDLKEKNYKVNQFICKDCENNCNIPMVYHNGKEIGVSYSGRCGKW